MRPSSLLAAAAWVRAQLWGYPSVPTNSDADNYMQERADLIAIEKQQRQDWAFRQNLSSVARQADRIVQAIRQHEIQTIWSDKSMAGDRGTDIFAGQMFPLARPVISQTKLWKIVKRMPKGSLLHAHISAMLPYHVLLEAIMNTEGMAVRASQSVATNEGRRNATVAFSHINTTIPASPSIDSAEYVPNTLVPIRDAAEGFVGGKECFLNYLKSKMAIDPKLSIRHEIGVDQIWRHFVGIFHQVSTMLTYEPILRTFYQQLFKRLMDDGVRWVEIRASDSNAILVRQGNQDEESDLNAWWEIMQDEITKFQATQDGRRFWGARVIWSDSKNQDKKSLMANMEMAIERKRKFPQLFSGYDVVSQEDHGRSLGDMAPELLWFQRQASAYNLSMPFFFHAGETLGDGSSADMNLFDAIILGTRRIGHAFSLYKHPQLIQEVIKKQILIEVCPVSNEVLRLTTDILHHPMPALIANGVPIAISSDDPAMLGQSSAGLSYDFYQVIQAFDNVGLAGLGALAQNSVRWSQFEDKSNKDWATEMHYGENGDGIKAQRMQEWNKEWEEFCEWIVDEYGSLYATYCTDQKPLVS